MAKLTSLLRSKFRQKSAVGLTQLESPALYRAEIQRLHRKALQRGEGKAKPGNMTVATAAFSAAKVSKLIASEITDGSYKFSPAQRRVIRWREKERDIYVLTTTDLIVHGAVASVLLGPLDKALPRSVYSYRKSRNRFDALSDFAKFVRAHTEDRPKKEQGLYVLRGDVKSYTDTIPVDGRSRLWSKLAELLPASDRENERWRVLERVVRTTVLGLGDAECSMMRGVATGSPVSTVCANVYLIDLDRKLTELAKSSGGFYARYGDDLLFAHEDSAVTEQAAEISDAMLVELELAMNEKKRKLFYFNGAGRKTAQYSGSHQVEFLGSIVNFRGEISLGPVVYRMVVRSIRSAIRKLGPTTDREAKGRAAAAVVSQLFLGAAEHIPERETLLHAVTDREQLKTLDYEVALAVAESVTGEKGPRAFRACSYQKMRREWKLPSITVLRNRVKRKASK